MSTGIKVSSVKTFDVPGANRIVSMASVTIVQPLASTKMNRSIWTGSENAR